MSCPFVSKSSTNKPIASCYLTKGLLTVEESAMKQTHELATQSEDTAQTNSQRRSLLASGIFSQGHCLSRHI